MKMLDIANGYMELEKLAAEKLPLKTSWEIDRIMKQMERPFRFYAQKEMEMLQKYPPKEQQGSVIRFEDNETLDAYNAEHRELDEIDEDVQIRPAKIDIRTDLSISAKSLQVLVKLGMIEITGTDGEGEDGNGCSCCG